MTPTPSEPGSPEPAARGAGDPSENPPVDKHLRAAGGAVLVGFLFTIAMTTAWWPCDWSWRMWVPTLFVDLLIASFIVGAYLVSASNNPTNGDPR